MKKGGSFKRDLNLKSASEKNLSNSSSLSKLEEKGDLELKWSSNLSLKVGDLA